MNLVEVYWSKELKSIEQGCKCWVCSKLCRPAWYCKISSISGFHLSQESRIDVQVALTKASTKELLLLLPLIERVFAWLLLPHSLFTLKGVRSKGKMRRADKASRILGLRSQHVTTHSILFQMRWYVHR